MATIGFVGKVDKKLLTLPLANILSQLGDTLIVTDDTSYQWFMDSKGFIGGFRVHITKSSEISFMEKKDMDDGIDYQHYIYDTMEAVNFELDRVIVVRGKDRSLVPSNITDTTDEVEYEEALVPSREVVITAYHSKLEERRLGYLKRGEYLKDKALLVQVKPEQYKWLWGCMETKEVLAQKDKTVIKAVVNLVKDLFKENEKNLEKLALENPVDGKKER